jgi:broad specificity phosphatase PhoE
MILYIMNLIRTASAAASKRFASTLAFQEASASASPVRPQEKTIVFLRHGCTYMNEHLGRSHSFGAPNFSDVFEAEEMHKYRDSPLSARGIQQAQQLQKSRPEFVQDLDLVVTSPLTRALQTFELGVKDHVQDHVPIIALPHAAERLYLISDQGRPVPELQNQFPYVDFVTGFETDNAVGGSDGDSWWYQHQRDVRYAEWRPTGKGQRYACPGEPDHAFEERMLRLLKWLEDRPESKIAVVCHWGVIDWMLDVDFDNCQWREVSFDKIQPPSLQAREQQR